MSTTFTCKVTHPYPSFQWWHRTSSSNTWVLAQDALDCIGYKTNALTILTADSSHAGFVKCIVSNPAGATVETREASFAVSDLVVTIEPDILTLSESAGLQS